MHSITQSIYIKAFKTNENISTDNTIIQDELRNRILNIDKS